MEIGTHCRIERNNKELNGLLPETREMRTAVKDEKSDWREVKCGVPQGLVLASIMFLIYINDKKKGVSS